MIEETISHDFDTHSNSIFSENDSDFSPKNENDIFDYIIQMLAV